jgi:integrase
VYALAVLLAAYTGVRVAELQGLQLQDVTLSAIPGTVGSVRIARTKTKRRGQEDNNDGSLSTTVRWIEGTPKERHQHQSRSPAGALVGR